MGDAIELRRDSNGRFVPGTPPANPGGRPRGAIAQIRQACREHCLDAVQTLVTIMQDEDARDRDRIAAAHAILERGLGKPLPEDQMRALDDDATAESKGSRILTSISEELKQRLLGNAPAEKS